MTTKLTFDTNLFIGGHFDGSRYEIRHGTRARLPMPPPKPGFLDEPSTYAEITYADYRRETIHGQHDAWHIWVHEELTIDQALRQIFKNYQSPAK